MSHFPKSAFDRLATMASTPAPQVPSEAARLVGGEAAELTGRVHELKTDMEVFDAVWLGLKTFEIRRDDREGGFQVGDALDLRETVHSGEQMRALGRPLIYTGRRLTKIVSHKLTGYGLADHWVCLSFAATQAAPTDAPDELSVSTYPVGLIKYSDPTTALRYLAKRLRGAGIDSSVADDFAEGIEFLLARRDDLRTATDAQGVGEAPKAVAEPEPMFYGRWHHGNGNLCCGSMRYFRADFDTNPAPDVREGIFDWICTTMNAALDRWREQKRAREEIEFGESPTASTTTGLTEAAMLTHSELSALARQAQIDFCLDKAPSFDLAFATAIQRACAEKWNVRLDGGAAK